MESSVDGGHVDYHLYTNNNWEGPFSTEQIKQMVSTGAATVEDYVCVNGEETSQQIKEIPDLNIQSKFARPVIQKNNPVAATKIASASPASTKSMVEYYLYQDDEQKGPFTIGQLQSMWTNGSITTETYYRSGGMNEWGSLREIVSLLEYRKPTISPKKPNNSTMVNQLLFLVSPTLQDRLMMGIVCLSLLAFFLPNVVAHLSIFGSMNVSMYSVVSSFFDSSTKTTSHDHSSSNTDDGSDNRPSVSTAIKNVNVREGNIGVLICIVSVLGLAIHYILSVIWGILRFALKKSFAILNKIWLSMAVQFPILFLIGSSIALSGFKKNIASEMKENPFGALGMAMANNISLDVGIVMWILFSVTACTLFLICARKAAAADW